MTIDPTIPFRAINHFDAAGAINNAFSLKNAARQSQMQEMQFQQQQEDRTLAQTRRQQFGQTLGGMVPPELAEFAKADPEGAMKLWEFKKSASKEQRQSFIDSQDMIANVAGNLRAVPQEQRAAAFQQIAPQLLQRGFNEEMLGSVNLTDAGLDGYISSSLGAKTVMEFGAKARDDDRADATLANKVQQDNVNNGFQAANLGIAQENLGLRRREAASGGGGGGGRAPSGYRFKPDGTLEAIPGGPAGAGKPLTEDQGKSTGNYRVMRQAAETLNGVKGYNPTVIANALDKGDLTGTSLNQVDRRALNAQRAFVVAALRMESGATYGPSEVVDKVRTLFPVPGDGAEVLADKARLRQQFLGAARDRGGPGVAAIPRLKAAAPSANAGANDLRPGMVQDGYRYRGGNKADPKSWVKVNR